MKRVPHELLPDSPYDNESFLLKLPDPRFQKVRFLTKTGTWLSYYGCWVLHFLKANLTLNYVLSLKDSRDFLTLRVVHVIEWP